jgi:nucleotide-binding universal stress UspA family protein
MKTLAARTEGLGSGHRQERRSTIVVPVDGRLATRALLVGRQWAELLGAALSVVAVDTELAELQALGAAGIAVEVVGDRGDLVDAVVRTVSATDHAAVCVATRARSPVVDVLGDDVAQQILRSVDVPVLLVGPHCSTSMLDGPVVVAHDGLTSIDPVLDVARLWSAAIGAAPLLLHVREACVADTDAVVRSLGLARERLGIGATLHVVRSSFPAGAIRDYVHEVDARLVAVATRGRTGSLTASTGPTATWLVRESHCPVLAVHPSAISTA